MTLQTRVFLAVKFRAMLALRLTTGVRDLAGDRETLFRFILWLNRTFGPPSVPITSPPIDQSKVTKQGGK